VEPTLKFKEKTTILQARGIWYMPALEAPTETCLLRHLSQNQHGRTDSRKKCDHYLGDQCRQDRQRRLTALAGAAERAAAAAERIAADDRRIIPVFYAYDAYSQCAGRANIDICI
jgi:hypothetical protein